jgi:hypothetical protein
LGDRLHQFAAQYRFATYTSLIHTRAIAIVLKRSSGSSSGAMANTFHQFHELPTELRVGIWDLALQNEKATLDTQKGRAIQLLEYDPTAGTIVAAISTRYPILFAVDREARHEAAKLEGCEWVTVHASYNRTYGPINYNTFKICINFTRDVIYLPELFFVCKQRNAWTSETQNPEHYHLKILERVLDIDTIKRIERISISTRPPLKGPRHLEDDAWWRGEGLDMFCLGNLKNVHLFSISKSHAEWARLQLEDYLQWHWVENGWKVERPKVTVTVTQRGEIEDVDAMDMMRVIQDAN